VSELIDPHWRGWVGRCVGLGAWLAVTSVFWLLLLVVAWLGDDLSTGAGPLALAGLAALVDIALLGNLGRWWMTPRWPHRPPRGRLETLTDPLGRAMPAATAGVLGANLVLAATDLVGPVEWLSLCLCLGGLLLLTRVLRTAPQPRSTAIGSSR
jgi:hypothetical protein